jgi:hypothetical protein
MKVLGYGLTFIPTTTHIQMKSLKSPTTIKMLKDLEQQLKIIPIRRKIIHDNKEIPSLYVKSDPNNTKFASEYLKSELPACLEKFKTLLHREIINNNNKQRHTNIHSNLNQAEQHIIKHLQYNPNLIVGPTDKNLGTFIMTTTQYTNLAYRDHLSDSTTYKQITLEEFNNEINNTRTLIDRFTLQHLTYKCIKTNTHHFIHKGEYIFKNKNVNILYDNKRWKDISRTRKHLFYLLPKIHKNPLKTRPIISCSGGDLENLAKWTSHWLNLLTNQVSTILKDTRDFKQRLENINNTNNIPQNSLIFSIDAVSLYTNIDTKFAINFLRQHQTYLRYEGPSMDCLCTALEIIMNNNIFQFQNTYFKQINGTAMGTAPAPPYANLVLGLFEMIVVLPNLHPQIKLYCRYIDDGFGIILNEKDQPTSELISIYDNLLKTMNSQNEKLKWTGEYSTTNLPFLDLNVCINNTTQKITTSTHIKAMNLHLFTPFSSCHPPCTYKGIIIGEVMRYNYQCDSTNDFDNMINNLRTYLQNRQYPTKFINNCIATALKKIQITQQSQTVEPHSKKIILIDNPEQIFNTRNLYRIEAKRRKLNLYNKDGKNSQPQQIFLKKLFHPHDPSSYIIKKCFYQAFAESNLTVVIANMTQPNLRSIIAPTDIRKKQQQQISIHQQQN